MKRVYETIETNLEKNMEGNLKSVLILSIIKSGC